MGQKFPLNVAAEAAFRGILCQDDHILADDHLAQTLRVGNVEQTVQQSKTKLKRVSV